MSISNSCIAGNIGCSAKIEVLSLILIIHIMFIIISDIGHFTANQPRQRQLRRHKSMNSKKKIMGLALILMSVMLATVAADVLVFETRTQTTTQQITNVASITTSATSFTLPSLEEGATATYNKDTNTAIYADAATLGNAAIITISKNLDVKFSSTELANFNAYYSSFTITITYASAIGTHSAGDAAAVLSIASPSATVYLDDSAGTYYFNYEISATAKTGLDTTTPALTLTIQAQEHA